MSRLTPLFLIAAGCDFAGQTSAAAPDCETTAREVALDEEIGDGFSAEQILAFASGRFEEEAEVLIGGPQGVTVEVAYDGGRVLACEGLVMELTLTSMATTGVETTAEYDRLDLEVEITLSTADGRFDEEAATAFLSATDGDWATTRYTLDPDRLNGSFQDPDADLVGVHVDWTPTQSYGELEVLPEGREFLAWPYAANPL